MKKISKKYLIILIFVISCLFYLLGVILINNNEYNKYFHLKSIIPNSIKHYLKNTIFIIPSLKKEIKILSENNQELEQELGKKQKKIDQLRNKLLTKLEETANFNIQKKNHKIKTKIFEYNYNQFETDFLSNGKADDAKASGYIEEYEDKIVIASGDGKFLHFKKKDLNKDNFQATFIKSNIKDIINYPEFYQKSKFGIKDLYIEKEELYISYSNQVSKDCFNTSILVAKINFDFLNFKKFFSPKECVQKENDYGSFNAHITGGRITNFTKNKILFSTGSFQYSSHSQNEKNIFGKVLSIQKDTGNWNLISMGHRNVQGLGFDIEKNIIFSTEHGPMGGDEFNLNLLPINEIKNYGWPISSYGEHYGGRIKKNDWKYKKAPLEKSHSKFGFIEPVKYFVPSIGISEVIKVPKKFNSNFNNDFFISSMGNNKEEGDLSIHHVKLNKNFTEVISEDVILINQRIRDLKYINDINKIILFVENSPGIGIISF